MVDLQKSSAVGNIGRENGTLWQDTKLIFLNGTSSYLFRSTDFFVTSAWSPTGR